MAWAMNVHHVYSPPMPSKLVTAVSPSLAITVSIVALPKGVAARRWCGGANDYFEASSSNRHLLKDVEEAVYTKNQLAVGAADQVHLQEPTKCIF